ncbi:ATP-binding protein [Streptomyces sp. NPDC047968]|uniref:ATP-binding protein n=1 Tax=unclassified Streptomyces TaxID=2593676 RepID=UPI00342996E8
MPELDAQRVPSMRRITQARLNWCGLRDMTEPVALIVSELVTNAIVHSGGTLVELRMQLQDGALYVAVGSDVPGTPTVSEADGEAEHGRGLLLVEYTVKSLDGVWGVSDDKTTVWCLLPAKGEAQ